MLSIHTLVLALLLLAPRLAGAQQSVPTAVTFESIPIDRIHEIVLPPLDARLLAIEDEAREAEGRPWRYAVPRPVNLSPDRAGTLEMVDPDTVMWRLRIRAPGSRSVNLGFGRYHMPDGGRLLVHATDGTLVHRPFTAEDNEDHGQLWTPVVPGDDVVVEVTLPAEAFWELELALTQIGQGYRGFERFERQAGSCHVNVVCESAARWTCEVATVGRISLSGVELCTGCMLNNTSLDRTPYLLTANHCQINSGNAASVVVYWNYQTSECAGMPDGDLMDFTTGSELRASYAPSDFTLLELDDPPEPAFGVGFAGWDRSGADVTSAVTIHHPLGGEKRISFERDPTTTTSYGTNPSPGDGTHVRVADWDEGSTDPVSSGAPLFDPMHRVIGQLDGGNAMCGNDLSDWFGKLSVSWEGGGTASTRLKDWLDPSSTGATSMTTMFGDPEIAKHVALDPGTADELGTSVAVWTNTAVVGAPNDDTAAGVDAGSVHVYSWNGMLWTEQAVLTASDAAEGDLFGSSVAIHKDTIVVGAPSRAKGSDLSAGAAYVFVRTGTTWTQQGLLTASNSAAFDFLGIAVAVSKDTAALGALNNVGLEADAGSVYVFERSGTSWSQADQLTASDGQYNDQMGRCVAIDGDTIATGAQGDDNASGTNAGAAYVFRKTGSSWSQETKLTAPDATAQDMFGISVSLSRDSVIVGAYRDDLPSGIDRGSAHVFLRTGTTWSHQQKLTIRSSFFPTYSGQAVAISGDVAIVGSHLEDSGHGFSSGVAYLFRRTGAKWEQDRRLVAPDGRFSDGLGISTAVSADTIVLVGAYRTDLGAVANAGAAYSFPICRRERPKGDGRGVPVPPAPAQTTQ